MSLFIKSNVKCNINHVPSTDLSGISTNLNTIKSIGVIDPRDQTYFIDREGNYYEWGTDTYDLVSINVQILDINEEKTFLGFDVSK